MTAASLQPQQARATAKGIALIFAQVLPVVAVVSLFPAIPRLASHFAAYPHAALLVPMIVTIPSFCIAVASPVAGIAADRFGRRPVFLAGLALYVVAGLAPLLLDDLLAIVVSRAFLGLAEAMIFTVSSTLIADYFGESRYRWVTLVGASQSVVGTLLIVVGGVLADVSWRGPFVVYALAIGNLVLATFVIDEPDARRATDGDRRIAFPWRAGLVIGAVTVVSAICYYVEPLHIAALLLAKGAGSATAIGVIQGATSLAYIGGSLLYRRIHHRRFGEQLALAGLLIGSGLVLIALSTDYRWAAAAALIQQFGAGLVIPTLLTWGQARLPIEQRGRGMGIWGTAFFSGLFLCPPLVSLTGSIAGGLQPAFLLLGVVTGALAVLAWSLFGREPTSSFSETGRHG